MLNPPLSLLSDDLLASIVEQLTKFPFLDKDLKILSLADRAFTQSCQKHIFRELKLGGRRNDISKHLTKVKEFFDNKPSLANRVRVIELGIPKSREECALLFKDPLSSNCSQSHPYRRTNFTSMEDICLGQCQ